MRHWGWKSHYLNLRIQIEYSPLNPPSKMAPLGYLMLHKPLSGDLKNLLTSAIDLKLQNPTPYILPLIEVEGLVIEVEVSHGGSLGILITMEALGDLFLIVGMVDDRE